MGVHVDKAEDLPGVLADALAHPGPALVDVAVNPDEPPLPGKVSYDQAKKFAAAWLRGQPGKASIATTLFRDKIQQLRG
jgi:pyruvate dehydrogenase (quinone)/pyruvate oxidase